MREICFSFQPRPGILTPVDEFQFWADVAESAEKNGARERAAYFVEQFNAIQKVRLQSFSCQDYIAPAKHTLSLHTHACVSQEYGGLDSLSMSDVVDLVEQSKEVLDDVWRQIEFEPSYPETRMVRLMDVIGRGLILLKYDDNLFLFGEIESCF